MLKRNDSHYRSHCAVNLGFGNDEGEATMGSAIYEVAYELWLSFRGGGSFDFWRGVYWGELE